jgi:enediyne biosynthesis protein E4
MRLLGSDVRASRLALILLPMVFGMMTVTEVRSAEPFVFRDVAKEVGLTGPLRGMMGHAAAWGDVDGDGKLDLFVGTFADRPKALYEKGGATGPVPNQLFLQRRGRFELSTQKSIAWHGRATGAVFADFDNDGRPDLYVTNNGRLGKDNLLYHNRGDGRLELVTDRAGAPLQLPETARGVAVFDYDGDGLLDLFVLATVGKGESMLFRNLGGMKFERSKALPGDATGLGVATGDLTGNGFPDVFVGGSNRLFVNLGGGKFREATELKLGTDFRSEDDAPSCGVAFGDIDRDGRLDMLIGHHSKRPWAAPRPLRLFRNLGSTPEQVRFEEITEKVGLGKLPMRAPHVEIRDFDNDGWPDLYAAIVTFKDGKVHPAIWKNLGAKRGRLPRFQETALVHRPDFPTAEDYNPRMRTTEFFDKLAASRRVMYFAPGPSGDYDNDGRLDLFLPSWFPTQPSMLLHNETKAGNYLDVEVVGGKGINRMGLGSMVLAYPAGQGDGARGRFVASEQIATGYGYASGQPAVAHLGLGDLETCDVVVRLPHSKGAVIRRGVKANQKIRIEAAAVSSSAWPPPLKGAREGTVTVQSELFLHVPEAVQTAARKEGAAPFTVARKAPTVEFSYHRDLGPDAIHRRLWSSWGDICVASDGRVYCAIGDHGNDAGGDARCFLYRWDPKRKVLEPIVDMNRVIPPQAGQPAWSKVHAKIDEGADGMIYFCCTLNDGNRASQLAYHWTERLPGGQLYQYDPGSGKVSVFASLPPKRCTATSRLDRERSIWWCNLEAGEGNALWGLDLRTKKPVFKAADGSMGFNRAFALARDGSIYFNGKEKIWHCDPAKKVIAPTRSGFTGSPGMRSATRQSKDGWIYGTTHGTGQLFRYQPVQDKLEMLGSAWLTGSYVTVTELSPDERFLYYLPGAHGGAFREGTPVIQYEIATGKRKVLAFLAEAFEKEHDYVPAGTYGMKVSADGSTLYVNFNGHAGDRTRPRGMRANGFGLCGFAAIHIPASER